jgi:HD-GYP domain-containing protein (c-di-GMP phosphodiesterase class II)
MKVLYHLIHTARIHKDNNQLIIDCLARFKGILDDMTKEDDLKIQVWRGRFHINGEKLPHRRDAVNIINQIMKYFSGRGIGGLQFLVIFGKASPADVLTFIRLLDVSVKHDNPSEWLKRKLGGHAFSWVQILEKQDEDIQVSESGSSGKRKEKVKNAYLHALETVREVADKASQGVAGVRKARRLAQTIVDLIQEDPSLILGLATIKDYDDYTYAHSVNVSLLATCLGRYIGLSRVSLECLSVCGLFHDLGKVGVSKDVLLKKGELNKDEWKDMQQHPLLGVRKILRLNADKELRSRIILGPFEHHLNPDLTGYPKTHFMKKLSLMGKILRITDVYEALTSERAYRPRSFTPDEALRKMWIEGAKSFDMTLLKSFIQMMGIYPIGSTVELNDGRIALVMDYPEGSQKDLPLVMTLENDSKGGMARGEMVNLAARTGKDGSSGLNIARGILPSRIGVQAAQFFLKEH